MGSQSWAAGPGGRVDGGRRGLEEGESPQRENIKEQKSANNKEIKNN